MPPGARGTFRLFVARHSNLNHICPEIFSESDCEWSCRPYSADIFFDLGKRGVVAGQEDLILESAEKLAKAKLAKVS